MRKMYRGWVLLSLLVGSSLAPAVVSAATVGAEVFGAFNRYAMNDVNDFIEEENTTNGANFDEVTGGLTGGLALRLWAAPNWMISAAWEPLFLETESTATTGTLNADANSFQITGAYFFPTVSSARYGIGAGLGHYSIGGSLSQGTLSEDVEGSGIGFHFMGLAEWSIGSSAAITGGAGYRAADVEIDDAGGTTANYSGFVGRVGLAFYMPKK